MTTIKKRSRFGSIWFRFKKSKSAMFGLFLMAALVLIACSADLICDYEDQAIEQKMEERLLSPSADHWFGTDQYGRDLFARVVFGARLSLFVGVVTILISLTAGTLIGAVAGFYGGKIDNILMRIMDIFLAIPQTLMAISIVAALGGGLFNLLIALSISMIPGFSRIVRASILTIKDQEFVEAAKACGTRDSRIILKHIIPNAIGPIIVQATLNMASTILSIAALSFIGLGVQAPTPEWGSILAEGKTQMRYHPYLVIIPGIAIVLSVMGLNLIGDGLRDALDPRLKN
ncbi:ABC transporter permease [Oscillibacter sp. MSJ-2]|uniref:ABC transporter permease n=1 Tax=Dysosmobacter acutus TaxID=2841504 RepID=A0ABS6F5Y0_9FIRM|nr:ABC transporter permease [Dysosmobacter acutus]MBU5625483.1 ABC transporter permease [Dysosmobacter acutus]